MKVGKTLFSNYEKERTFSEYLEATYVTVVKTYVTWQQMWKKGFLWHALGTI